MPHPPKRILCVDDNEETCFMLYTFRTGAELCRHIRESRPGAKVIFYSGAAFDEDRERGLAAGACAYVNKPEVEGLVEAVKRALGGAANDAAG